MKGLSLLSNYLREMSIDKENSQPNKKVMPNKKKKVMINKEQLEK
jgi:hypothetical protein